MINTLLLLINVNVITVINVNESTYVNDRVHRQLLIYLMTVITTTSTRTPCSHSPVDKRLVWNGMVWFGMQECEGVVSLQEEDQL